MVSRNSFDSIVISSVLGLVATAIYNNYYYIMNALLGLLLYFCLGIKASVGNKIATQSVKDNYEDMLAFSFGFYLVYGPCTICLCSVYQSFMEIWVGNEYTVGDGLPFLMCLYFFLFCSVGVISQYWEAAGLFWENRYRFIVEAICNLGLNIVLVFVWGLNGVIVATIVSMLFSTNIIAPIIAFKYYFKGCNIFKYFIKQGEYFVTTFVLCLICNRLCNLIVLEGIRGIFLKCFIIGFLSLLINIIIFSKTQEFLQIKMLLVGMLTNSRTK